MFSSKGVVASCLSSLSQSAHSLNHHATTFQITLACCNICLRMSLNNSQFQFAVCRHWKKFQQRPELDNFISIQAFQVSLFFPGTQTTVSQQEKTMSGLLHWGFLCPFSLLFCLFPGCQNLFLKDCLILCKGCVELEVKKSKHRETEQEIANTKRTMYAFWG